MGLLPSLILEEVAVAMHKRFAAGFGFLGTKRCRVVAWCVEGKPLLLSFIAVAHRTVRVLVCETVDILNICSTHTV